jgi:hypothetical protein
MLCGCAQSASKQQLVCSGTLNKTKGNLSADVAQLGSAPSGANGCPVDTPEERVFTILKQKTDT